MSDIVNEARTLLEDIDGDHMDGDVYLGSRGAPLVAGLLAEVQVWQDIAGGGQIRADIMQHERDEALLEVGRLRRWKALIDASPDEEARRVSIERFQDTEANKPMVDAWRAEVAKRAAERDAAVAVLAELCEDYNIPPSGETITVWGRARCIVDHAAITPMPAGQEGS